jgi:uncharacterized protein HemX
MKAPVALALLLTLLALGPVGCATTSNQEKSPEQLRLEAEYNALREQKQAIEQEERAVHARAKKLYRQASSLEAKRKLGSPPPRRRPSRSGP